MDKATELEAAENRRRRGDLSGAVLALRSLASAAPDDSDILRRLAELLVEAGNVDGAISELIKAQQLLVSAGDISGAIAAGEKVISLDPGLENPLAHIAKMTIDGIREDQKKRDAATVPVPKLTPLGDIPLLSELTPDELSVVAGAMTRHQLDEGKVVFEEGEASYSLYFVTLGRVEVRAEGATLGVIAPPQCFGEFSFLTGEARTASVRCLDEVELLELSAEGMHGVVANHPRLKQVLFEMYRDRALANVLSRSPLFEMLPSKERTRLAPRFNLVNLAKGQRAFEQGQDGSAIFLIKDGSVVVEATIKGERIELARLRKHQFFGEVSFLTGVPRTATVHALESTELLKIEEHELLELVRHHPYMKDVLSRYHLDRVTATAETLKSFLKREGIEGIVS